jgi:hypothetical protein
MAGACKILCRVKKGITFWYINVSCKIIIKSVRELCVVSHCVFLKITNARIPQEQGTRLRHIGPIALRPALGAGYGHSPVTENKVTLFSITTEPHPITVVRFGVIRMLQLDQCSEF